MVKFLVIQTAFIGDVVLATALIEKLHQHYPDAQIDFMLRKGNEALLKDHPYLKHVYVWNKKQQKYKNLLTIAKQVRAQRYDYIINPHRFSASGAIAWYSNAKEKRGFDKNPFAFCYTQKFEHKLSPKNTPNPIHEVDRNQQLIADITDNTPARPALYPTDADYKKVSQYQDKPYICLAPSSVWFTKMMPEDKWVGLINKLPQDHTLYFIAGPGDKEMCQSIIDKAEHPNRINLAGELNFLQSTALMKDAAMNYANDSAPIHFASSINAPITAVFCSTSPNFGFGPLSDTKQVVQVEDLECKPCNLRGLKECPLGHFRCGHNIDVEQLTWWMK